MPAAAEIKIGTCRRCKGDGWIPRYMHERNDGRCHACGGSGRVKLGERVDTYVMLYTPHSIARRRGNQLRVELHITARIHNQSDQVVEKLRATVTGTSEDGTPFSKDVEGEAAIEAVENRIRENRDLFYQDYREEEVA